MLVDFHNKRYKNYAWRDLSNLNDEEMLDEEE